MVYVDFVGEYLVLCFVFGAQIVMIWWRIFVDVFFFGCFMMLLEYGEIVIEVVLLVVWGSHVYFKFGEWFFDWVIVGVMVQFVDDGWWIGLVSVGEMFVCVVVVEWALVVGVFLL